MRTKIPAINITVRWTNMARRYLPIRVITAAHSYRANAPKIFATQTKPRAVNA